MKKLKVVILSLFTLVLGTVLCACCNFKDAKASFSQSELVLSANAKQETDLDEYLSVEGVSKSEIELKFNDSSLFSVNGHKIKALPSAAGQESYVYAMYKNNSLASMKIVVTSPFDAPENFNVDESGSILSDEGLLTWDAVSTFYANEKQPTLAKQYSVTGQWVGHDDISATVTSPAYQLPGVGQFSLKIKALASGHLEDSAEAEVEVFYGYMPAVTNLTFENGVLSWEDDTEGAQYQVEIDDVALDTFSAEKSKDLTAKFDGFDAKDYTIKVISHDPNNVKFDMRSSELVVTKLAAPTVSVVNGKLSLSNTDNRAKYYINLKDQQNSTQILEFDENLAGVSGKYTLSVYAIAKEDAQGVFYQSNNSEEKQVYKLPKVSVERDGENPIGGDVFNIKVTGQAEVDTTLKFTGVEQEDVSGFGTETTSQNVALTLENAKKYTITVRQSATSTDELLVVDSDESDTFEITKFAAFDGAVKHEYVENKSRFTFAGLDGVTDYDIQLVNGTAGEDYVTIASVHSAENTVVYDFDEKIEDIKITSGDVYKFRIVAKAQDGENAISSFITKELTLLSTPVLSQRENTQKRFEWTGNASKFEVKVYSISKEQYTSSQGAGVVEDASNPQTQTTENNFIVVEEVGYYFITVQAISTSEDVYISSAAPLNILAIVAEKLEMSEVVFGYDKDHNGGAYYLDITSSENVTAYSITTSDSSTQPKFDKRVYLTETFESQTEVSVVAKGSDDDLYLPSEAVSFSVNPLAQVTMSDFQIDDTCKTLSMKSAAGVTRMVIKKSGVSEQAIDTYTLSIIQEPTFVLEFTRYGSDVTSGVDVKTTAIVYLPSKTSEITFNRVAQPTNFRFENDLKFDETQAGEAAEYVLDILCETAEKTQYTISVRVPATSGEVYAVYESEKISLGDASEILSTESNTRILKLSTIIEKIKASTLQNIYAQASEFTFSVYAYQNREKGDGYQIASLYAKTAQDESTSLKIEKMKAPELSYNKAENALQWNEASVDGSSYELYIDGESIELFSQSYSLEGQEFVVAKVYTYYLVAKNAKYLESANSNTVNIQKLAPVSSVTLGEGVLTFGSANSANLYSKVQYQFDSNGFKDAEGNSIEIPEEANSLTIQYIGKEDLDDSEKNYYLDSAISSWTLKNMSTLAAEKELSVTFENNKISWTEFSTLPAVDYAVVFTATSGSFKYTLSGTELTLDATNSELLTSISNLSAGNVDVKVYAHLNAYTIQATGEIYYAKLIEGVGCNYHEYSNNETIQKYATPQVTNVEFEYGGDYSQAQKPKIVVTFTAEAEYDGNAKFVVMLNDEEQEVDVSHEENYSFTITEYEKQDMKITIQAVLNPEKNVFAISSAVSEPINIVVAQPLSQIEFVKEDESEYLTRTLHMEFDNAESLGGVVLALSDGAENTQYTLQNVQTSNGTIEVSVEEFITSHLASGGKITASAFVNNYVNMQNKTFILASESLSTQPTDVLKKLDKESDIQESSSGFKIINPETDAIYVVEIEGLENQILSQENEYTFVFPDSWDGTQSHDITLTAKKNGAINSLKFSFTFTLKRVSKVENVHFEREENNTIKLVWNSSEEAKEYKIFVYLEDEKVADTTSVEAEYLLFDLLGENYSGLNLTEEQILSGVQLKFGVVAVPTAEDSNDSQEATLQIKLNGIDLTASDIDVDEFGLLYFNSTSKEYIYRLKTREDEVPAGFDWTTITGDAEKTYIDTSKLELDELFNVEIAITGDLQTTLDSVYVSSDTSRSFDKLEKIASIYISNVGEVDLNLEKYQNFITGSCIYVGASEDALKNGKVLKIVLETTSINAYHCNFESLIENLQDDGVIDEDFAGLLYFWVGKDASSGAEGDYDRKVTASSTTFEFVYSASTEFDIIKINDDIEDATLQSPDYINSYASFTTDDSILGVYVKITKVNDEENEYKSTKLIKKEEFGVYKGKSIANLTALFDDEEDALFRLAGDFEIQLSLLKTNQGKFEITKWQALAPFKRIGNCQAVALNKGILTWSDPAVNVDLTTKYIVNMDFFHTSNLENVFTYTQQIISNNKTFDPTKYVAEEDRLYIGVRPISDNAYVISGRVEYYSEIKQAGQEDFDSRKIIIYKNSMANGRKLELENGSFVIKWKQSDDFLGDFISDLNNGNLETVTTSTYTAPFTFKLSELVNYSAEPGRDNPNKTTFQLRFKKADDANGIYTYYDIDAFDLLANFVDEFGGVKNFLDRYDDLIKKCGDNGNQKAIMTRFFQKVLSADHGIANSITLFDTYFEGLQKGAYTLEYCILGNATSLASQWYKFERADNQYDNQLYVNEQPDIKIIRKQVESDESLFATQVVIKKSKIYKWQESGVAEVDAESYGIKFGAYTLLISKIGDKNYSLSLQNSVLLGKSTSNLSDNYDINDFVPGYVPTDDTTIKVYVCDETGNIVDEESEYLMFYVNNNGKDSLVGAYGDSFLTSGTDFELQVYAVGDDLSVSSKSEYYKLVFLNIMSFAMNEGQFVWKTRAKSVTNIYADDDHFTVNSVSEESNFDLSGYDGGAWTFKFVVRGNDSSNVKYVDSDVYLLKNVYKLYAPDVAVDQGNLVINSSKNNTFLSQTASENDLYRMRITNDATNLSMTINRVNNNSPYIYEAGITDMASSDPNYNFKSFETQAKNFGVTNIGTTTTFTMEKDESGNQIRILKNNVDASLGVALTSDTKPIPAAMLNSVQTLNVANGVVSWNAVTGTTTIKPSATVTTEGTNNKIVYKVRVTQYRLTATGSDAADEALTAPNTIYEKDFYTLSTQFDFANIKENEFTEIAGSYFKVRVQALALRVSTSSSSGVPLIEKDDNGSTQYGSGYVLYDDSEDMRVLIGNGVTVDGITRMNAVEGDTIKVENGVVKWEYKSPIAATATLKEQIAFVVAYGDNQIVDGQFDIVKKDDEMDEAGNYTYSVTFTESKNKNEKHIPSGKQTLAIYTSSISGAKIIKSYARTIDVTKLPKIEDDSIYEINTRASGEYEELTFKKYFDIVENMENTIEATIGGETIKLDKENYILYIVDSEDRISANNLDRNKCIVVTESSKVSMQFVVTKEGENILYSDPSDEFFLQRSAGIEEGAILWDETAQKFTWEYYNEEISDPTFYVTVTYSTGTTRIYTMQAKEFTPTIISDNIGISIRVKLNNSSVLSQETKYDGTSANFNLFASGWGTLSNPYIIQNETQFINIQYRMTKSGELTRFTDASSSMTRNEEARYYFQIDAQELNLTNSEQDLRVDGLLFKGNFTGTLEGNDCQINYNAKSITKLSETYTVSSKDSKVWPTRNNAAIDIVYQYGASLFEAVSGEIRNLNVSALFKGDGASIPVSQNILVGGLTLFNSGTLRNIKVTNFNTTIFGSSRVVLAYGGVAAVNREAGAILNCSISANISLNDNAYSCLMFFGGICYNNSSGRIEGCVSGDVDQSISVTCAVGTTQVQIAGIAVSSLNNASITGCTNNYKISVACNSTSSDVYAGGIAVLARGTCLNCQNTTGMPTCSGSNNAHLAEIFVTNE